jgi:hypothetical protein
MIRAAKCDRSEEGRNRTFELPQSATWSLTANFSY